MKRALEGIRVLDIGSYIAAPYCCMLLADHGAGGDPGGTSGRQDRP